MKTNDKKQTNGVSQPTIAQACRATCNRVAEQIGRVKAGILSEFRGRLEQHEHLLELAVNEAEALAWQTGFPQLVFPALAMEKASAASTWHEHQRWVQRMNSNATAAA